MFSSLNNKNSNLITKNTVLPTKKIFCCLKIKLSSIFLIPKKIVNCAPSAEEKEKTIKK